MLIGLTGGLASGKSLASRVLKRLGAHIIDADVISREIAAPGRPAFREIIEEFGEGVLNPDGSIDRKALGSIVFSDPERLKRLNSITHPRILEEIARRVKETDEKDKDELIVIDAALLIETGIDKDVSRVVVVYADEKRQMERLKKRDGLEEAEAEKRIKCQMPLKEKLEYADYVIDNNGTVEETEKAVEGLYRRLKGGDEGAPPARP